jgi:hypothetical protein
MKNGTIGLDRVPIKGATFLQKTIYFFTAKPYYHAKLYFENATWEETTPGAIRTPGYVKASEYWEPTEDMTLAETERGRLFLQVTNGMGIRHRWPYNFLLTFVLFIVYPTRWFWNWIKWVPFSSKLLGLNCSAYCDKFWRYAGRDIRPKWQETLSAPGDLRGLPGFHQ